jgi:hypothetical protein
MLKLVPECSDELIAAGSRPHQHVYVPGVVASVNLGPQGGKDLPRQGRPDLEVHDPAGVEHLNGQLSKPG